MTFAVIRYCGKLSSYQDILFLTRNPSKSERTLLDSRGQLLSFANAGYHEVIVTMSGYLPMTVDEIDRVIQMAWEDRTSFDAILVQFDLTPGEVIKLMRAQLKSSSFRLWRARTSGRKTKHVALRGYSVGRFRCPDQKSR